MAEGGGHPWGSRNDPGLGRNGADKQQLSRLQISAALYWSIITGSSRAAPLPGPLPVVTAGNGATRDGEHLAVVHMLHGGVPAPFLSPRRQLLLS